jgi:3-dehydroquinate synthase
MSRVELKLGRQSYPIRIGAGEIRSLAAFVKARKYSKIFVISDERLSEARSVLLKALEATKLPVSELAVKAGESLKDFRKVYPIYESMLEARVDRDSVLIALGGGSVGDAAGFVASTYLRGIDWIGVPTTLLAQVDSSVGGKTGVNHRVGKNLIGAFHQPALVLCELDFLKTLSPREIVSGLGEVVKYGLTFDLKFLAYLETHLDRMLTLDPKPLQAAVERSLDWKCRSVARDERDRSGVREVLNFGHTFGHALESATRYRRYQHGEAVIWGMRFALALSEVRGHLTAAHRERGDAILRRLPVPPIPKKLERDFIFSFMKKDKKSSGGKIRFVLLDRLGHSVSDSGVKPADLERAYAMLQEKSNG